MTSFACRFYFNKIKFFTKNKQLKNSHKENFKERERRAQKSTMHANDLMKIDAVCTCMMRSDEESSSFRFIEFKTCENDPLFDTS